MAEFQEQQAFRGAFQSQGFDPITAPDTSRYLRENMGMIDANFNRLAQQQQQNYQSQQKKTQDILNTLGQFSETAMNFAKTMGKAYIDAEVIEGHTKAINLNKGNLYGVDPETIQQYNQVEAEEENNEKQMADVALGYAKDKRPIEAQVWIKSLPRYQQIGATRAYLDNLGKSYPVYLESFFQRTDIPLPGPNGTTFTPNQAVGDPVLTNIALGAANKMFLGEEAGFGADFNPSGVASLEMYKRISEADNTRLVKAQRLQAINQSAEKQNTAKEIFDSNQDLNMLYQSTRGLVDDNGQTITNSDALDRVFDHIVDRYYAGDTEVLNSLDTSYIDGDPNGQTWRQRFKNRIEGEKGLNARIEAIDRRRRSEREDALKAELEARKESFRQAVIERSAEGNPFSDEEIQAIKQDAMDETGLGPSNFRYLDDYITVEEKDQEQEQEYLDDLRRNRGFLIEEDLRNVSSGTYRKYISIVQDDDQIAKRPTSYSSDNKSLINALTNEAFELTDGTKEKSSEWEDMARRARDAEARYYAEEIRAGNTPEVAQANTIKRLKENFAAGTYTYDPAINQDQAYLKKVSSARLSMATNPDIDQYVFANSDADIEQLFKYNEGKGEIPKLYYDLAQGQKALTAWDIASAQFVAAGYGELGKAPKQVQLDRLDPALQRVLNYKPTPNRVARARVSSFNSQTSSLPSPAFKQAADIVGKYEDAGAGYNAVNQIGVKGGRGVLGFSGDFTKMTQHGGRPLTDHTLGEVLALGAEQNISNDQWIEKGKIHAAGRYQFIHNTLKGLVQRHNLPPDLKFSPQVQDFLFLSLLSTGGLGQWIGPSDHATSQERAVVNQAKQTLTPQLIEQLKMNLIGAGQ